MQILPANQDPAAKNRSLSTVSGQKLKILITSVDLNPDITRHTDTSWLFRWLCDVMFEKSNQSLYESLSRTESETERRSEKNLKDRTMSLLEPPTRHQAVHLQAPPGPQRVLT